MSIESTLAERGDRYGDFTDHAEIAQALQKVMQKAERISPVGGNSARVLSWECINPVARQALTVIADKIARILSGDPNYADNWHDIQGYAKLVEDRLPRQVEAVKPVYDPAEHLQDVQDMAITFGKRVAIMDAYIKAGDTGETYTDYEARMLGKDQAPIDPADVDISDNSHPRWKDAPDWANYLAQDGDGLWYWYEHPIYAHEDDDAWYEQRGFDGRVDDAGEDAERNPDWRNTRHARPTK